MIFNLCKVIFLINSNIIHIIGKINVRKQKPWAWPIRYLRA